MPTTNVTISNIDDLVLLIVNIAEQSLNYNAQEFDKIRQEMQKSISDGIAQYGQVSADTQTRVAALMDKLGMATPDPSTPSEPPVVEPGTEAPAPVEAI